MNDTGAKGVKLRLAGVAVAFLIPALVMAHWLEGSVASQPVPPLSLPNQLGVWQATQDQQLSEDIWALIEPDAHLMRLYQAPGRSPIWLYVGVYARRAGSSKAAHDPEICYPGQGWEIMQSRSQGVPLETQETFQATALEAHNGARQESVLYWFQPAGRWPVGSALEQLLYVYDAVSGRPQYAFVRLSSASDGGPIAAQDLTDFAGAIAPAIRSALERSPASGGDRAPHASL